MPIRPLAALAAALVFAAAPAIAQPITPDGVEGLIGSWAPLDEASAPFRIMTFTADGVVIVHEGDEIYEEPFAVEEEGIALFDGDAVEIEYLPDGVRIGQRVYAPYHLAGAPIEGEVYAATVDVYGAYVEPVEAAEQMLREGDYALWQLYVGAPEEFGAYVADSGPQPVRLAFWNTTEAATPSDTGGATREDTVEFETLAYRVDDDGVALHAANAALGEIELVGVFDLGADGAPVGLRADVLLRGRLIRDVPLVVESLH